MLREVLVGIGIYLGYYVAMVALLYPLRKYTKIPGELFRKMLHISVAGSVFVLLHAFEHWYLAAAVALVVCLVAYVVVHRFEARPALLRAFKERQPGELRSSLTLMFVTMAALITLGWGVLGAESKFLVAGAIMAWGFGDAAAALIGKSRGKRKLNGRFIDNKKTVEGTAAMFGFATAALFLVLLFSTGYPWYWSALIAVLVAPVAAVTELVSHQGVDTITVPFATFAWLALLTWVLSLIGWL